MAQPSWITGSGSLGTIPEGKFYRASLEAYDPDFPSDSSKVKYTKISGSLPKGIQINSNGTIEGTPTAYIQGIPNVVSENVTSKFSIRVYTEKNTNGVISIDKLNDRTFTITITGQNAPEFVTPAGSLGNYFDGQLVNKQIVFDDDDPGDTATISLVSGELPPGVNINSSGLIYGYIEPATEVNAISAWENEAWDSQPLQFNTGTISKNYEFALRITDGTDYNLRTFSIYVGITTADSTAYTVDSSTLTADIVTRAPFMHNYTSDLGTFLHNNFFSYQFNGVDYNDDILNYSLTTGTLPSGLVLDTNTGFIHGTLSNIGLTEQSYSFSITVYKKENILSSNTFDYTIKIIGDINANVTWETNENLGIIDNGSISNLEVSAVTTSSEALKYRLKQDGTYNKLPQGLELHSSGSIIGRVRYETFGLIDYNPTTDSNKTTDSNIITADTNGFTDITFDNNATTIDKKFTFTVEAYSNNGQISTFKTFNIRVNRKTRVPTHELKINALLSQNDREIIDSLLQNQDIIKYNLLYRPNDPYYNVATNVTYTHAYGLSPELLSTYAESIDLSHYNKQIILGDIKTARALDDNGDVLYEVVYSDIIDNLEGIDAIVNTDIGVVYPNSLDNMRNGIINKVGKVSSKLPKWMLSKQENGNILGFTEAWVIAYTLPSQAKTVAYSINKNFKNKLNKINFMADRYTLTSQFVSNWDAEDQRWYPTDSTTFDRYNHGVSADSIDATSDTNTVRTDLVNPSTLQTTFDGNSCIFVGVRANKADISIKTTDTINITADNGNKNALTTYQITDKYDKYLMFPKKDIINTK